MSASDVATAAPSRRRRNPVSGGWLGVLPLFLFGAIALGLPLLTIVYGAFTTYGGSGTEASFTTANLQATLDEPYFTSVASSVKLSAVTALLGVLFGLPLAHLVVTSSLPGLREAVLSASGVLANFGGVPLAFAFVATLGNNAGVLTNLLGLREHGWNLYSFWGLALVYLYFLIPLMVLTLSPAMDGLKPQWREAAANNRASGWQYWRHVALPVLLPSLISGFVLLFGSAFSAYSTAAAMVGSSVPLVTLQIAAALSGDVLVGQGNVALALGVDMVVVAVIVMAIQIPLQRRSAKWLG